jgi:hypothetical protein
MAARKQRVVSRDVNATNRALEAVRQRTTGKTYQAIADDVGYASPGACRDAIMRELHRCACKDVGEYRAEQMAILNRLLEVAMPLAIGNPAARNLKDRKPNLFAHDRVLGILDRMMKLTGTEIKNEAALVQPVVIREIPREVIDAI